MRDACVKLAGGRQLAYTDIGDPGGSCVVFFHGAPMSRLHLVGLDGEFAVRGLRVVSPDRPGYGGSSPQPGRSMADWPNDVAALADALGIGRVMVAGHSSGGPYAVACAALRPERVLAGVVLGGVADMTWPGAREGYIEDENQIMSLPDEGAATAWCAERYGADGARFLASPFAFPQPDVALLGRDEAFERALTGAVIEAFRQGVIGYAQDVHVQGRPWPFDPSRIAVPFEILHGMLDTLVPVAHSHHTASSIPGSTFSTLPGHGHLTPVVELPAILSALRRSHGIP